MSLEEKETVTITTKEYEKLLEKVRWLGFLTSAGVDNWSGISYAYELRSEWAKANNIDIDSLW